jgi:2-oxoglutarate dehydrogenase E2 component (dihydrolipoamide succinyltransferase)
MLIEIKIPRVGESVEEAVLAQWYKQDGDPVQKEEPLFVIETDKVTLEIEAEAAGRLKILVAEGETVAVGAVAGTIDTEAAAERIEEPAVGPGEEASLTPAGPKAQPEPAKPAETTQAQKVQETVPPSVRRLAAEKNIDVAKIKGTGPGGRITKGDVLLYLEARQAAAAGMPVMGTGAPESDAPKAGLLPEGIPADEARISRKPMSPIRRRIAARLLEAKQHTAMLTTFNEIDMSSVMAIRERYKESFNKKYGVPLGIMSFFVKASIEALKEFPEVNAFIEDQDIIYHAYCHIGVAIGAERGLVVPVIRHAERLGFAELEKAIIAYVEKIKDNRLELNDLEGGTFTISNGGVYGSLLSTPILNIPQSGILGMHKIEKRPVVVADELVIRPMMYVALSYDHRIVDGREAVTFLKRIKSCIENPERILLEI